MVRLLKQRMQYAFQLNVALACLTEEPQQPWPGGRISILYQIVGNRTEVLRPLVHPTSLHTTHTKIGLN